MFENSLYYYIHVEYLCLYEFVVFTTLFVPRNSLLYSLRRKSENTTIQLLYSLRRKSVNTTNQLLYSLRRKSENTTNLHQQIIMQISYAEIRRNGIPVSTK